MPNKPKTYIYTFVETKYLPRSGIRYTNNASGDLLSLTDGKGQTTRWNYDQYGRVTNKVDQAAAEILRYTHDPNNQLTNRWSAAKGNTAYSYDAVGNLSTIHYPLSGTINFSYDALNRMTNMVDGVGTTKYTYTAAASHRRWPICQRYCDQRVFKQGPDCAR